MRRSQRPRRVRGQGRQLLRASIGMPVLVRAPNEPVYRVHTQLHSTCESATEKRGRGLVAGFWGCAIPQARPVVAHVGNLLGEAPTRRCHGLAPWSLTLRRDSLTFHGSSPWDSPRAQAPRGDAILTDHSTRPWDLSRLYHPRENRGILPSSRATAHTPAYSAQSSARPTVRSRWMHRLPGRNRSGSAVSPTARRIGPARSARLDKGRCWMSLE